MASRVISILATLAIVAAMVAPALAQSSGGSTGTGTAPATGSGSSTPSTPPAPSATQPSTSTPTRTVRAPATNRQGEVGHPPSMRRSMPSPAPGARPAPRSPARA